MGKVKGLIGSRGLRARAVAVATVAFALLAVAIAPGAMRTEKISRQLCETTGGGRFVGIPWFPGERIDRRLLNDIRFLKRRWPIHITDGYSLDPVHSRKGEHPIGLALDIVPDFSKGGRWRHITQLARWAEPKQNHPRAPFRWVGYNGDPGHGRGNHLHLSWSHSETRYNKPARTVWTVRCPGERKPPAEPPQPKGGGKKGGKSGGPGSGGISATSSGTGTGGLSVRLGRKARIAPAHPETGGISVP